MEKLDVQQFMSDIRESKITMDEIINNAPSKLKQFFSQATPDEIELFHQQISNNENGQSLNSDNNISVEQPPQIQSFIHSLYTKAIEEGQPLRDVLAQYYPEEQIGEVIGRLSGKKGRR